MSLLGGHVASWAHYGFKGLGQKSSLYLAKPAEIGAVGNRRPQAPC